MNVIYDLEYVPKYPSIAGVRKWDKVRGVVDALKPVRDDQKKGWARIEFIEKKEAARAQTSANSHSHKQGGDKEGWQLRTSVDASDPTRVYLWMRKVWNK